MDELDPTMLVVGYIGFGLSIAFMIFALAMHTKGAKFPWWVKTLLWSLPTMPFVAVACLVLIVLGSRRHG